MVVYVDWEGRNYHADSLFADLTIVARQLRSYDKMYTLFFDVGILISDTPAPDFTKVVRARHGQADEPEDWTKDADLQGLDEYIGAQNPTNWHAHDSIYKMLKTWLEQEIIS